MVSTMIDHASTDLWVVPKGAKCFEDPSLLDLKMRDRIAATGGVSAAIPLVIGFSDWRLEGGEVLLDGIDHRRLWEAAQHDVADVVVEHAVLHELQVDLGARDGERQLARIVTAVDGDLYLGADRSALGRTLTLEARYRF